MQLRRTLQGFLNRNITVGRMILVLIAIVVIGVVTVLITKWQSGLMLLLFRWLIALIIAMGGIYLAIRWQYPRLAEYEPNTCIKCGQFLDPDEERCLDCGTATQASLKLDVGAIIAMLSSVAMLLAGLIVGWKAMWTLMGLLCLTALLLFYYNRKEISLRRGLGLGNILRAGYKAVAVLVAIYVVWLVWVLS